MEFIDLGAQQARIKDKIDARIQDVLAHGRYIMGPEVIELEQALAGFCGVKHALTCANGTDALLLALMALNVGENDVVFVPSFTFAASVEVVPTVGATPFFVDIDPATYNIDLESLKRSIHAVREHGLRPKAAISVDLFGLPADYAILVELCRAEDLFLIEDSAQGWGAQYNNQKTGSFGDIATTSFFPAKPLGCYGDGGAIFTNNDAYAATIDSLRVHGKGSEKYDNVRVGMNSRLDTLQAAILLEKLAIYADEIEARQSIAARYSTQLEDVIAVPFKPNNRHSIWAQYTLRAKTRQQRDFLMAELKKNGVPSVIYYPVPLHEQTAYKDVLIDPEGLSHSAQASETVFSLPMSAYLTESDQDKVCAVLRDALQSYTS